MSEIIGTRPLGFGVDDRTTKPQGEAVIGRDPAALLGADGVFEPGDVVVYNYLTTAPEVDATAGALHAEDGVMSNVELMPAALNADVIRSVRAAVVLPSKGADTLRATQQLIPAMNGGVVGEKIRTAASGLVVVKVRIPVGATTIRPGASLVLSPGQRYLSVASGSNQRIVGRLVVSVGPNAPDGTAYTGGEVVWALAEFQGDLGFGMDIALA